MFDTARLNENIELIIQNSLDEQMNICGWSWRYFYDKSLGTQSFKWDKVIITGYNLDKCIFNVKFEDSMVKKTDRLGLLFNGESIINFISRIEETRYNKFNSELKTILNYFMLSEMPKL